MLSTLENFISSKKFFFLQTFVFPWSSLKRPLMSNDYMHWDVSVNLMSYLWISNLHHIIPDVLRELFARATRKALASVTKLQACNEHFDNNYESGYRMKHSSLSFSSHFAIPKMKTYDSVTVFTFFIRIFNNIFKRIFSREIYKIYLINQFKYFYTLQHPIVQRYNVLNLCGCLHKDLREIHLSFSPIKSLFFST